MGNCGADCHDCGRAYGDEHGFPDLIIPNYYWNRIAPKPDGGGRLCPSCICAALHKVGIRCEGAFMSGPVEPVSRATMFALRDAENVADFAARLEQRVAALEDSKDA